MGAIKFVRAEERTFVSIADRLAGSPELQRAVEQMPDIDFDCASFVHHEGGPGAPRLAENIFGPGAKVAAHAHDEDEIMVVTAGEIRFGSQVLGVGSSVFVPKLTLYAFEAGPEGLTFLVFRPAHQTMVVSKAELVRRRKSS